MLDVFLTVDTEISSYGSRWRGSVTTEDIERDIYGVTTGGQFGLPYQIERLNAHGLKAVFFVEALFAEVSGREPLRDIVQMVQNGGQEVQLHLHTEWLPRMPEPVLAGRTGDNMKDFSEEEQQQLIACGLKHLEACGARGLRAFRAGNYGANCDTLRALAQNGILFDSSYNFCYLDSTCGMRLPERLLQPQRVEGVCEFPVSVFQDYPGHHRHAQLCACSSQELEHALDAAWRHGWKSFVIVSHSFELIRRARQPGERTVPDRVVIRRFERLCRFLDQNRDRFRTAVFADQDPNEVGTVAPSEPFASGLHHTALRWSEQLYRKLLLSSAR